MSSPDPVAAAVTASMAAAAQSLRDTAKWLVGGVVTTAAGVFAGSSLTSLGSLDLNADRDRLVAAGIGLLVGFSGLAIILALAIRVLERGSITFRELSNPNSKELEKIEGELLPRYANDMQHHGVSGFAEYMEKIDATTATPTEANRNFLQQAQSTTAIITADAGFQLVRRRFGCLINGLIPGTLLAVAGFGVSPGLPPAQTVASHGIISRQCRAYSRR